MLSGRRVLEAAVAIGGLQKDLHRKGASEQFLCCFCCYLLIFLFDVKGASEPQYALTDEIGTPDPSQSPR